MDIRRTTSPKTKPNDESQLGFGKIFSDHMFIMEYETGKGWHNARIQEFTDISLSPASMVFHYAQEIFEGLKAYRTRENKIMLFRPEENFKRMNRSAVRSVIPEIDVDYVMEALSELIKVDSEWVPGSVGASLYIRPFIIAVDAFLGVRPADKYYFMIITSPSGAYYSTGLNPVSIAVEEQYVRAVKGGTGFAKAGGNYAASLLGQKEAQAQNYEQVLWLDGIERKYIEEVGAMNVFFVINGEVITPELTSGSILPGITRMSAIELCRKWGMKVTERKLPVDEIFDAFDSGALSEAFGTGTAAVISPIGV
ncbi:MAG: branched-chain amino acid aminotransferase, partial [Oscillospiraceae bacterium]|nr:branched-chain amino acid aminotransferase [Oscillospiraceae bacterium]